MILFNNALYDKLKWVAQYVLPGLATLYFALSGIWNLPYPERIVGTIVSVDVFLGALLGLSTLQYNNYQKEVSNGYKQLGFLGEDCDTVLPSVGFFGMSSKTYEIVKWITLILLPASGTLYFALSRIWLFPYGQEVVGTIASITAFAGLFLGVSTAKYESTSPNKLS